MFEACAFITRQSMIIRVSFKHLFYQEFRPMRFDQSSRRNYTLFSLLLASTWYVYRLNAVLLLQAITLQDGQNLLAT